jgi:N-acetylmuramoyl-L-alanine amidase
MKKTIKLVCEILFLMVVLSGCQRHTIEEILIIPVENANKKTTFKKSKPLIVVDAGHGGEDFGTHSLTKPRYQEKNLTLSTSVLLREYLVKMGYDVAMTREDDIFISLDKRAEFANGLNPLLFVSVHYNSAPSKQAEGIEVYYYKSDGDSERSRSSKQLADAVLRRTISNTQAKSRGVKHGNFAVIRETRMPAILIEGGFMSHEGEMSKIKNPGYIKQLAWGIAQGIHETASKIK